jgi:uncharacterized protein (DUF2141 family)
MTKPFCVDLEKFADNFEVIFGKKKKAKIEELDDGVYVVEVVNKENEDENISKDNQGK